MPHLIDQETGLCQVCQRLKLAGVRDMKVHKRLNYEARKKAIEKIVTTIKDPRYKRIVNNNYVHYDTQKNNYFNVDTEERTGITITDRLPKFIPQSSEIHMTSTTNFGVTNLATIDEQNVHVDKTSHQHTVKKTADKNVPASLVDYRYNSAVVMSKTLEPRNTVVVKMNSKEKFTRLTQINLEKALNLRKSIKPAFNLVRRSIRPSGIKYIQPLITQLAQPTTLVNKVNKKSSKRLSGFISGRPKVYIVKEPESESRVFFHPQPLALSAPPRFLAIKDPSSLKSETTLNKELTNNSFILSPDHIQLAPQKHVDGPIHEMSFSIRNSIQESRPVFANAQTIVPVNNQRPFIVRNVQDVQPKIVYASTLKQPSNTIKAIPAETTPPTTYTMYREPSEGSSSDLKKEQPKPIKNLLKDPADDASVDSELGSTNSQTAYRNSRKLLSGFHPFYDKESDILHLQCCTCCIGCCRKCSTRCTGCENFMSCPIYCWLCFIVPIFILLCGAVVFTSLLASYKIPSLSG